MVKVITQLQIFYFASFSHLKEHVKVDYIDTNDMSDDQLLMQYFKKHDTDNNAKLDGLELLKALIKMEGIFKGPFNLS